jgi:hypothetical protein
MAAELLLWPLPPEHFATAGAAAALQQQLGQVLRLLWVDALGCVTSAEGCYTGQPAVRLAGYTQAGTDSGGQNTHDDAAVGHVEDSTSVCAAALAAVPTAAVAASNDTALPQVLQLALAAVEALLLWPGGISRQRLLWCMCNKVPGTKAMAHVVDIAAAAAAAAAVAAATTLDKLMAAQLLQQQQQQQHASTAGQQQATAAGGITAAAGVAAAVLPSSSRLRGSVSGACKVLLAPAFLELVFGTGYGCNTAAAAAAAAAHNGHSQAQSEAQQPALLVLEAANLAVQDLRGCVTTACQYVISHGAAWMQQQLLLQLLGLQHSSSVAEGVLGLCKAVGVVTASGSGTELKLWCCG